MRVALLLSRARVEEKLLLEAFRKAGVDPVLIFDQDLVLNPTRLDPEWRQYDVLLERSLSTSRGLYTLQVLEAGGVPTVNSYRTAATCADKLLTTVALARAGVPQPPVRLAFSEEASLEALEQVGYPAVLKPVLGSWGRMLAKLNDRDAAEAVLEHRKTLGGFMHQIGYIQPFIRKREGRDIRAYAMGDRVIGAIYRTSPHWITNTARGASASKCPVTAELEDLCQRAAAAVGGGALAIDIFETDDGLVVNEVNHTMEFRNSIEPTGVDIPAELVSYVLDVARAGRGQARAGSA